MTAPSTLSEVIAQLAPAAVVDVFGSYGVRAVRVKMDPGTPFALPREGAGALVAGVVGFTGATMQGTLLLVTAFEVIAAARPAELRGKPLTKDSYADWILVRDWSSELANQVLGRIKNRLHSYGVSFDLSPPTALSGAGLAFATPKGPSPQHHTFVSGSHKILFCFDGIFDPSQRVTPKGTGTEPPEGKVILFD